MYLHIELLSNYVNSGMALTGSLFSWGVLYGDAIVIFSYLLI
jgi:hypothetical protein